MGNLYKRYGGENHDLADLIAITSASLPTKKRILTVCVKLFLEKGYKQTTLAEINEKAGVSFSQF